MELMDIFNTAAAHMPSIIGGAIALSFAWSALKGTFFTNAQQQEALITRFGKHIRTIQEPGLHFKIPFIDKISARIGKDLLQVTETLETKTKDDLFVRLPISIQFEISDSAKYHFQNRDALENMKKSVSAAVRTATAGKEFQELYGDRDEISDSVIDHIKNQVSDFGVNIRRIIIDEPSAPAEVQTAFNEVRASERLKEAARNKAEAHKIELVARAQAEKEADILRGQGKAGFREAIFNQYSEQISKLEAAGVTRSEAVDVMMRAMEQDTLRDIGDKGNMVIVSETGKGTASSIAELQTLASTLKKPSNDTGAPTAKLG